MGMRAAIAPQRPADVTCDGATYLSGICANRCRAESVRKFRLFPSHPPSSIRMHVSLQKPLIGFCEAAPHALAKDIVWYPQLTVNSVHIF